MPDKKNFLKEIFLLAQFKRTIHHYRKVIAARVSDDTGHTASKVERIRWMLVLRSLYPFYSVQDHTPWNGAQPLHPG